ncbi:MAG TPA: site-2 protease family protein [Candidatus Limnocylindria bacterium]|nr:site-2 protease family protein [Candidatus Limnocylindria bacterium]
MESSLTLGRVAGIRVGINWTWLFVFALVTWSLATAVFPNRNPGLDDGTYWAMAGVAAVLFFGSILLHELGHALQARRDGIEIEGITLWLFGGVAALKSPPRSSGAELRMAAAGPLVTVAIAVVSIAIAALAPLPTAVDGVVAWLGYINVFLLAFNLVPALPLDGGRILHALLWHARGELVAATRTAATIGRAFGFFLIAAGIVLFVLGALVGGIWLAFIGWFLSTAAGAEEQQVVARERLGDVRVRDLMIRDPVTVESRVTIGELVDQVVWRNRHTTYPVVDDGRAKGLLPFRRVAELPRSEWEERTVADCMVPLADVPTLSPDEFVADALDELRRSDLHRALVLDDGRLVGLLSPTDVAFAVETGRFPPRKPPPTSRLFGRRGAQTTRT